MKRPIFKDSKYDQIYFDQGYVKTNLLSADLVKSTLEEILKLNPDDNYAPDRP